MYMVRMTHEFKIVHEGKNNKNKKTKKNVG